MPELWEFAANKNPDKNNGGGAASFLLEGGIQRGANQVFSWTCPGIWRQTPSSLIKPSDLWFPAVSNQKTFFFPRGLRCFPVLSEKKSPTCRGSCIDIRSKDDVCPTQSAKYRGPAPQTPPHPPEPIEVYTDLLRRTVEPQATPE